MASLIKHSKSIPPVRLSWRARLLLRYVQWVGPVTAARTGVAVVRHRRALRTSGRVATAAGAVVLVAGVAVAVKRQADRATTAPAT
jgi:hypothetical protein